MKFEIPAFLNLIDSISGIKKRVNLNFSHAIMEGHFQSALQVIHAAFSSISNALYILRQMVITEFPSRIKDARYREFLF